jgi:hypothetical protein
LKQTALHVRVNRGPPRRPPPISGCQEGLNRLEARYPQVRHATPREPAVDPLATISARPPGPPARPERSALGFPRASAGGDLPDVPSRKLPPGLTTSSSSTAGPAPRLSASGRGLILEDSEPARWARKAFASGTAGPRSTQKPAGCIMLYCSSDMPHWRSRNDFVADSLVCDK